MRPQDFDKYQRKTYGDRIWKWTSGRKAWMDGCMDGWTHGWMDKWVDEQMVDGWLTWMIDG